MIPVYEKPTNMEELSKVIEDLDIKSTLLKKEIEETASHFVESLKPVNLLKSALQPVTKGPIGKMADKLLLGYRKLVYKRAHAESPDVLKRLTYKD
jgi:hypothetical protein